MLNYNNDGLYELLEAVLIIVLIIYLVRFFAL